MDELKPAMQVLTGVGLLPMATPIWTNESKLKECDEAATLIGKP
ncbi:hypothetical protein [Methylophilus sp. 14]|nr:hypothetical protein [Methylophilus sp. 14]